ncbi:hypothetical protein WG68_14355 [Arsukibacterium ikkense]|uniref:Uncharacterized protein n=1 Tax=Arsukibacterium ikkense TaxID=336831 RepID=A0A0M2V1K2_9GAMM|nr:hypothetical protein [Arsukibacterium ikkense]KKO44722.1 hypothetical protein WG68_14355 [Arsukibacterium ikkense]
MTSRDFAKGLEDHLYLGESIDDLVTLIDIFTVQRGIQHNTKPNTGDFLFSAAILCVILTPCKPPGYRKSAVALRKAFAGIANSRIKQEQFRNAISEEALDLQTIAQLVTTEFNQMFHLRPGNYIYS